MDNQKLITFGKYKYQPIEVLLSDTRYTKWFMEQEWAREKYSWLYNAIRSAMTVEDTPEHNEMQSRFLDKNYCKKVAKLYSIKMGRKLYEKNILVSDISIKNNIFFDGKNLTDIGIEIVNSFDELKNQKFRIKNIIKYLDSYHIFFFDIKTDKKIDLVLKVIDNKVGKIIIRHDCDSIDFNEINKLNDFSCYKAVFEFHNIDVQYKIPYDDEHKDFKIELKPIISDDFMSILRKAKQQHIDLVLCDKFTSQSVSFTDAKKMFLTRNIILETTDLLI